MPDDEDYKWLAQLLADPAGWTEEDFSKIRFLAGNQRDAITSMHPLDKRRRMSAERAAEEMEAAIAEYESRRAE